MGIQERDHYRSRCRGGDNIKMNLKEIDWRGMGWIDLAQEGAFGRLLWAQYVLSGYINCREFLDYLKSYYLVTKNSVVVVGAFICDLASVHQGKDRVHFHVGIATERILSSPWMGYLCEWQLCTVVDQKIQ